MKPKNIFVHSGTISSDSLVWSALEELVPVKFHHCSDLAGCAEADAIVLLSYDERGLEMALSSGRCCFVMSQEEAASNEQVNGTISFTRANALDYRLRGRSVSHNGIKTRFQLQHGASDQVLASHNEVPIWVKREHGPVVSDFVAFPLPVLAKGEHPLDYFNGDHFIQLLPLLHFLREIVGEPEWQEPPLRACFMFDDPNLHWSSYGYIPYRELADLAQKSNFHVAFATVPLDGWFVHGPTAALFRENAKWLSLLIHGNNHLFGELGVERSHKTNLQLYAQSLRRIENLERRSGLQISRIMAPPHGACTPQAMEAMLELGFEAACISAWSLRDWGGDHPWPASFGLQPSEIISGRFAVPPRFRMSSSSQGAIMISAFLNRPIIPVGHHDTLAEGLDLLPRLADFLNSFGSVTWGNVESIARSNYRIRREGEMLCVKPDSMKFNLTVPDGITSVFLSPLSVEIKSGSVTVTRTRAGQATSQTLMVDDRMMVEAGDELQFASSNLGTVDYRAVPPPFTSPWAFTRRVMCEMRDRVQPLRERFGLRFGSAFNP